MKKLFLLAVLLTAQNSLSQKQYVGVFADVRNGLVGSEATIKTPALDLIILGGVTDRLGITIEAGYEHFEKIKFSKMYIGLGYTIVCDKLEYAITVEPTAITREWGGYYGTRSYTTLGASIRTTYKLNSQFGISLLCNALKRYDNADRYRIKAPIVYSIYLGIVYTFKRT